MAAPRNVLSGYLGTDEMRCLIAMPAPVPVSNSARPCYQFSHNRLARRIAAEGISTSIQRRGLEAHERHPRNNGGPPRRPRQAGPDVAHRGAVWGYYSWTDIARARAQGVE